MKKTILIATLFILLFSAFTTAEIYSVIGSRELTESTDGNYAYMNQNQFFHVYYGDNPSSGNVVKIIRDGVEMSLLPMALNWNNDLSQLHQISMPQPVSPTVQGSDVIFNNAYGSGIHLKYETQGNKVKEKIIIDDFSDLETPAQYVIDGGGVVLEVGFQLGTNAQHIEIDGADWDKKNDMTTTNDVVVKNDLGEIIYTLPRPYAVDNNGVVSYGSYQFKSSANKLYIRMYFDYSFLKTATYPVVLDPTFFVDYSPTPATQLQDGDVDSDSDSEFDNELDVTSGVSDNSSSTQYVTYKHIPSYPSFLWYKEQGVDDTSKISSIGGTTSNLHIEYSQLDYGRILMTGGETLKNGDKIYFYMQPKASGDTNKVVYLKDGTNSVTYGTFNTGTDTSNYQWRIVTLTNIASPITQVYIHDNTLTTGVDINVDYIQVETFNETGYALSGRWAETYDDTYNWWLGVKKETAGTHDVWVYGYENSDDLDIVSHVNKTITGTGIFYIPVDDLLDEELNTHSLSFSQLRFYSILNGNFSEFFLRAEANDTSVPSITNCNISDTLYTCNETAHLYCTVTDDISVDYVYFEINGVNYTATKSEDIYNLYLPFTGYSVDYYNWTNAYAFDLIGNQNTTFVNETFQYVCIEECTEDWIEDMPICLINDTYLSTYTDQNTCNTTFFLPAQNGTYQPCNYCSQDLEQVLGTCQANNTQSVDWVDNNYFTCCAVTGLPSDCDVETYPYNVTTTQTCAYYENQLGNITCQAEPNLNPREKEYCIANIPNQYLNETFKCISYVVRENTGEILQTNPEYRERSSSLFDFKNDPETREYFAPANALVNFYYTGKNLKPEEDYILTIDCSSQYRTLRSEKLFQMAYEDYEFVFFRTRWLMTNAGYIITGIIVLFIIIAILWLIIRQV